MKDEEKEKMIKKYRRNRKDKKEMMIPGRAEGVWEHWIIIWGGFVEIALILIVTFSNLTKKFHLQ